LALLPIRKTLGQVRVDAPAAQRAAANVNGKVNGSECVSECVNASATAKRSRLRCRAVIASESVNGMMQPPVFGLGYLASGKYSLNYTFLRSGNAAYPRYPSKY
jgi:hypothetical protein